MARRQSKPTKRETRASKIASESVDVRAVKVPSGRAATAVEVEIAPDRLKHVLGERSEVREVVSQCSDVDGDLQDQRLSKMGERNRAPGERVVRYSGTHYGSAGANLKVQVKTQAGTVEARPRDVREADKPGGGGTNRHEP